MRGVESSAWRAGSFVAVVTALAGLVSVFIWRSQPEVVPGYLQAVLVLGALALMGEAWQFMLPRSASASIAFIPYAAMALVVPHWTTLGAIAAAKLIDAYFAHRKPLKSLFNIAQFVVMSATTIWFYRELGGHSFIEEASVASSSFAQLTANNGIPALVGFCASFGVNMLLTSTVIALHTGRRIGDVWRENHLPGMALALLAAPVVFLFAWVYVKWGAIAAALFWVPILGYRHTIKTTVDLEQTNRELLELMIKSIEARDAYTSGHSRRVQQYAMLIARAIGLSEKQIEHVGTAALLHDVGKIHEKYGDILTKEEMLSPDEWAVMREHPIDGAELIATMTRLHEFVPAVRHHHENWDGTGYPDGLAGENIPLASRIIMFADTIDAMTTARPYRGPLGEDVVRGEIVRRRGEQFDPSIADALLSSTTWKQLFVPAHPSTRGQPVVAVSATGEFVVSSRRFAKNIVARASGDAPRR